MLLDYGITQPNFTVYCDNTSAINISRNPVQHSLTKHIDICYHFIRSLVENNICCLHHVSITHQHANLLTKALSSDRFEELRCMLGICCFI